MKVAPSGVRRHAARSSRRRRRGSTLVEFVVVSSFLFTMFFGVIEFGLIFRDRLYLVTAVRNGARDAATGQPLAAIRSGVQNSADLPVTNEQIGVEYNTSADGTGNWVAAADNTTGGANNVPVGSLLRVRISAWPHRMVSGGLLARLVGSNRGQLNLNAVVVMRRE